MNPSNENTAADKAGKKSASAADPAPTLPTLSVDSVKGAEIVTIHVQRGEGDDEKDGIYVGINGQHDFVVPRGVDVSVPYPVYEILCNAKRAMTNEDGSSGGEASRFAVSLVGGRRH